MKPFHRLLTVTCASAALLCAAINHDVQAQAFPTKPIRLIVGYAPGGGTDIAARIVARRLGEQLGQQVVVDNRPGANGNIGAEIAARALPDGYTVLMTVSADAINAVLYPKLPFNLARDFAAVGQVSATSFVLVVHPSVQAQNPRQLVELARTNPGKLNYATFGTAGIPNLAIEMLKAATAVKMVQVSYRGSGPALADVVSGQVEMMVGPLSAALPLVKAGRLRALGVASAKRNSAALDLPTLHESGLPGLVAEGWNGILAPAGAPPPVVGRLNTEIAKAVQSVDVHRQLVDQGYEPTVRKPDEFAAFIKAEIAKWQKVITTAGVKPD
jgi:tripartite-type tricarboxylate transporter receptor subunit TctC